MKLIPISEHPDAARILYDLLAERPPEASISHKKMPTWEEHLAFIASDPYWSWYLIQNAAGIVGCVYLSYQNEIGISIFREFQGRGYGPEAVNLLIEEQGPIWNMHGGVSPWRANVNPRNAPSIRMFERLGFKLVREEPTQTVYERAG